MSYLVHNYERVLRLIYIFMKAIIKSNVALFKSVISMKDYENGSEYGDWAIEREILFKEKFPSYTCVLETP